MQLRRWVQLRIRSRVSGWVRDLTLMLLWVGAFFLLYGYMDGAVEVPRGRFNASWIRYAIAICLAHLIYIAIVCEHTLLLKPTSVRRPLDVAMPFFLVVSYVLFGVSVEARNMDLYCWSLGAFLVVYILWIWKDSKARRKVASKTGAAAEALWIVTDAVMIGMIAYTLSAKINRPDVVDVSKFYEEVFPLAVSNRDVKTLIANHAKDIAVIVFILFYAPMRVNIRPLSTILSLLPYGHVNKAHRTDAYREYLNKATVTCFHELQPMKEALAEKVRGFGEQCMVLDIGCTDGKRVTELYENVLKTACGEMRIMVKGVDREEWRGGFDDRFRDTSAFAAGDVKFLTKPEDDLSEINIVHVSHVLYTPRDIQLVADVVSRIKPGSLLFVRGIAANSPFYFMSIVWSAKAFGPFPQHSWVDDALKGLVESYRLGGLVKKDNELRHDWLVIQDMGMETKEDAAAMVGILERVFDQNCEEFAAAVYEAIQAQSIKGQTRIPNWDVLYVYEKGKP